MMNAKQTSEVDIAYHILRESGQAMYFRDLITKVLDTRERPVHSLAHAMSEIHTQINMDSRFVHMGKGTWGLADWAPQQNRRSGDDPAATAVPTARRREKLFEEIQQDYVAATIESTESE